MESSCAFPTTDLAHLADDVRADLSADLSARPMPRGGRCRAGGGGATVWVRAAKPKRAMRGQGDDEKVSLAQSSTLPNGRGLETGALCTAPVLDPTRSHIPGPPKFG